jgi:putative membrane protein insertion efficiency factor
MTTAYAGPARQPGMWMGRLLILLVRGYQHSVAAVLGGQCRFYPTCSAYCIEAIERHGCGRGLWLSVKRVLKCHPFHPGGVDRVPGTMENES